MEVSQLDTTSLAKSVNDAGWTAELVNKVADFGRIEESPVVSLSKLNDKDEK
jgi:hypothetical protein